MKKILTILYVLLLTFSVSAKEWSFKVDKDSLHLISTTGMHKPAWYMDQYGVRNFVNLSFFTGRGFIPPYKDDSVTVLRNPFKWPYFCIGDSCYVELGGVPDNDNKFIFSGYPVLLKDSQPQRIKRSFFSRRVCPRTAVGVTADGWIIIYVTTGANLKTLQKKMTELGCVHAINLDGGSSTFLYLDGEPVISSRQARTYPNILSW